MTKTVYSHMAIACPDPDAVERFYSKYFGFRRARVVPLGEQQIVFLKNDADVYLELFQAEGESPASAAEADGPNYPAWRHIAFQVDDVDAKLAEIGTDADITLGPLDFDAFIPGWRTVWLRDPAGLIVEVSQGYTDQDSPPPLSS